MFVALFIIIFVICAVLLISIVVGWKLLHPTLRIEQAIERPSQRIVVESGRFAT